MNQEYFIVKDENGIAVGKRKVVVKKLLENSPAYLINDSLVFSIVEYIAMQELAENLPELV